MHCEAHYKYRRQIEFVNIYVPASEVRSYQTPLDLELWMVVSHHGDAKNQPQVF